MGWFKKTSGRRAATFETTVIGSQLWMTKNFTGGLRPDGAAGAYDSSWDPSILGDTYTFTQAALNAPPGWHLPSAAEFSQLQNVVIESNDAQTLFRQLFEPSFFQRHACLWTSTLLTSKTRCLVADMAKDRFDAGVYIFDLHDKSDLFLYPARYLQNT